MSAVTKDRDKLGSYASHVSQKKMYCKCPETYKTIVISYTAFKVGKVISTGLLHFYRPQTKLREGNVCLSPGGSAF